MPPRGIGHFGDAMSILTAGFKTITICTAATGCLDPIDLTAPPDPATHANIAALQPAAVLDGPLGKATIAPYGMPSGISADFAQAGWTAGLGVAAALVGAVLIIRAF